MKRVLLLLMIVVAMSACNLSQQGSTGPSGEETLATLPPTPNANDNGSIVANCDPRTTGVAWVLYTAREGDTLESVTHDQGTSKEIMLTGNCWTEFPTVKAGDQWYVPPASIDPLPDLSNVPYGGKLDITPATIGGDGGTWSLVDKHVTLSLTEFPANAASVFFYVRVNGEVVGIGTDFDLSDGATFAWDTLPNLTYLTAGLAAVVYDANATPILKTYEFGINTV
ncbi:MAG: hypothetical protein ABI690_10670 [Chloroflexota bacterium]